MLYRGTGTDRPAPDTPTLDAYLSRWMRQLGHRGSREPGSCIWASTSLEQALDYAGQREGGFLYEVEPLRGAVIGWAPDCADMILSFEAWLRSAYDNGLSGMPSGCRSFLMDVAGDVVIFDQYLNLGRQRRLTDWLVSTWLDDMDIKDFEIQELEDVHSSLDGHRGEVWISGPCRLTPMHRPDLSGRLGF